VRVELRAVSAIFPFVLFGAAAPAHDALISSNRSEFQEQLRELTIVYCQASRRENPRDKGPLRHKGISEYSSR
jgi:hypothetical protein